MAAKRSELTAAIPTSGGVTPTGRKEVSFGSSRAKDRAERTLVERESALVAERLESDVERSLELAGLGELSARLEDVEGVAADDLGHASRRASDERCGERRLFGVHDAVVQDRFDGLHGR